MRPALSRGFPVGSRPQSQPAWHGPTFSPRLGLICSTCLSASLLASHTLLCGYPHASVSLQYMHAQPLSPRSADSIYKKQSHENAHLMALPQDALHTFFLARQRCSWLMHQVSAQSLSMAGDRKLEPLSMQGKSPGIAREAAYLRQLHCGSRGAGSGSWLT